MCARAQKAEELKKEKMAVAFTYGLKEKAGGGGLEFDAAAVAAANGDGMPKSLSKPKKPKSAAKKDDWVGNGSSDSTSGIPTPPDEVSPDLNPAPCSTLLLPSLAYADAAGRGDVNVLPRSKQSVAEGWLRC